MSRPARRLFAPEAWAAVRRCPSGGIYVDASTLATTEPGAEKKAAAGDRRLPCFARDYPVLQAVRVRLEIDMSYDEDRLRELARSMEAGK